MSERAEKKPLMMPPYWGHPPAALRPMPRGPYNKQQKRFRLVLTAFTIAKIAAAATMAFLIIWMI